MDTAAETAATPPRAISPTPLKDCSLDEPIVTKRGYDLSFLDRLQDLENATPGATAAVTSSTVNSASGIEFHLSLFAHVLVLVWVLGFAEGRGRD